MSWYNQQEEMALLLKKLQNLEFFSSIQQQNGSFDFERLLLLGQMHHQSDYFERGERWFAIDKQIEWMMKEKAKEVEKKVVIDMQIASLLCVWAPPITKAH